MSRGADSAHTIADLDVALGPVEETECAIRCCSKPAVYRVPYPVVDGAIAFCGYHLARYRTQYPDLWARLQEAVEEELSVYATRGDRFLTFQDVPETLFGGEFRAAALLVDGTALYLETDVTDAGTVRAVNRSLDIVQEVEVKADSLEAFLGWVETTIGVHTWADGHGGAA